MGQRHDERDPAKQKFGKPTTGFPDGSLDYPRVDDQRNARKTSGSIGNQPGARPFLAPHKDIPRALLIEQTSDKGDDVDQNVTEHFEVIPGPITSALVTDEMNKIVVRVTKQKVVATPAPLDAGCVIGNVLTFTGQPADGDTITIGSQVYTFKTVLTNVSGYVLIDADLEKTLSNLVAAVMGGNGSGTWYAAATAANSTASVWNTLTEIIAVTTSGSPIATTKSCSVAAWSNGIWSGSATPAAISMFVEYQPINVLLAVRIVSFVVKIPADEVFWSSKQIGLPDKLVGLTMGWDESYSFGASSTNATGSPETVIRSEASASHFVDGSPIVKIESGYHGEAVAKMTRSFKLAPPAQSDITAATKILAAHGTINIKTNGQNVSQWVGVNGSGISGGSRVQVKGHTIGPILTNAIALPSSIIGVVAVRVTARGSGYNTVTIGFTGGGGTGAAATAVVVGGELVGITITNAGTGYLTEPSVTIADSGGGTGAAALARVGTTNGGADYAPSDIIAQGEIPTDQAYFPQSIAHAEGHATWNVTASTPASFASGATIVEGMFVEKWRLGLYLSQKVEVIVP